MKTHKPKLIYCYFNGRSENSNYSHPEIRIFVETWWGGGWGKDEVCSIRFQSDHTKHYSLLQSYAPELVVPHRSYTRHIPEVKSILNKLLFNESGYRSVRELLALLYSTKATKISLMDIGNGDKHYQMEFVPTKVGRKWAQAWYAARQDGKELTIK